MNIEEEVRQAVMQECGLQARPELSTRLCSLVMPDINRLIHVLLVLERRFDLVFGTKEIDALVIVGDLVACVERKVAIPYRSGFW
jgi:hypothetical protein